MKYIILFIFSAFFSSCAPQLTESLGYTNIAGIDFTKYTERGFLFTPESYNGDYEAIAILNIELSPEIRKNLNLVVQPPDSIYRSHNTYLDAKEFDKHTDVAGNIWYFKHINLDEAINKVHSYASEKGADAITNFRAERELRYHGNMPYTVIIVSGFAIKRK